MSRNLTRSPDRQGWFLSRRRLLKLSLAAVALLLADALRDFLSYQTPVDHVARLTLDVPESYPHGSATFVADAQCWIIRDDAGLYAVSAVCTHLGCQVRREVTHFTCPCHGSQYGLDGTVKAGPAVQPLQHLALSLLPDNRLLLDTRLVVPAAQRLDPQT